LSTERSAFIALVGSVHPKHFVVSDTALIVSYIQASILAHELARKPDRIKEWETVVRAQCSLAVKLRLAPSTRSDPKTIARHLPDTTIPRPWLSAFDDGISETPSSTDDDEAGHDH
jgi:hypothetical protein